MSNNDEEELIEVYLKNNDITTKFMTYSDSDKEKIIELGLKAMRVCDESKRSWNNMDYENKIKELKKDIDKRKLEIKEEKKLREEMIEKNKEELEISEKQINQKLETLYKGQINQLNITIENLKDEKQKMNNNLITRISQAENKERDFWSERYDKMKVDYEDRINKIRLEKDEYILRNNHSQKKGVDGEEFGIHVCNQLFPTCEIEDTHSVSGRGDIVIHDRDNSLNYLLDIKNYASNVPKKEIEKFYRDIENNDDVHGGLLISLNTGIIAREDFSMEFRNNKPIMFLHNLKRDPTYIKLAITSLSVLLKNDKCDFGDVEIYNKLKNFGPSIKRLFNKMRQGIKKHEETMMKLVVEQEGIQKQIFSILNIKY